MSIGLSRPAADASHSKTVLVAVSLLLGLALFTPTLIQLAAAWSDDPNYSHGFLILPFSMFLAYRHLVRHAPESGSGALGAMYVLAGCVVHLATAVSGYLLLDFAAMFLVLRGLALAIGGRAWAAGLTFPFAFLFFMFPLPVTWTSTAAVWLQGLVAQIAGWLLSEMFVTYRQGNAIFIAGLETPLYVAEECSGLRQLVAFLALGCAMAYFCNRPWFVRLLLVAASAPVAILSNVLRVVLMAVGARWFGVSWLSGWMHDVPAFATLPIGLVLFLFIARLLGGLGEPEKEASGEARHKWSFAGSAMLAPVACLLLGLGLQAGLYVHLSETREQIYPDLRSPLSALPMPLAITEEKSDAKRGWTGKVSPRTEQTREVIKFSYKELILRDFKGLGGNPDVEVYMIYSREGKDRLHHPEVCMRDSGGFPEIREERAVLYLDSEKKRPAMRFCFRTGLNSHETFYYWHYTFEPTNVEGESLLQRLHRRLNLTTPSITVQVRAMGKSASLEAVEKDFLFALDQRMQQDLLPPNTRVGCDRLPIAVLRD